jgi:hypothetical protein
VRRAYLDAVVTVGKVLHGLELLVDDADAGLVCSVHDTLDVCGGLAHSLQLLVQALGSLDGRLRVELGYKTSVCIPRSFAYLGGLTRVGDLEENVLHDVASIPSLELERLAAKVDVVETPCRSRQNGRQTLLTLENLQDKVDSGLASVTSSPGLSGHGVGRVSISAHRLAVNESLRNSIPSLSLVETHHLRDDCGGSKLDQDNVVQADLVERVLQRHAALDFVCPDHSLKNIPDLEDLSVSEVATSLVCACDPVSGCEDGTQVVRWMTPLGGQPAVVEVEPSDHSTNVEGTVDGIELVVCAWNLGAIGDGGAFYNGSKDVPALLEAETLKTAAESVNEDPSCSVELYKNKRSATASVEGIY